MEIKKLFPKNQIQHSDAGLQGYNRVVDQKIKKHNGIEALSDEMISFHSTQRLGYFVDPQTQKRVVLSPEDIAGYNPANKLLLLGNGTTDQEGKANYATLSQEISFLSAMALSFEASSPAAFFVKSPEEYLFGNVESIANRAFLPEEVHQLSLGLMSIQFQNIAARRIAKVNANWQDIEQAGGDLAGIVLFEERLKKTESENSHSNAASVEKVVELENVLRIIEFNIQLDSALSSLLKKSKSKPEELKGMNGFYDDLESVQKTFSFLQVNLKSLRAPLFFLTRKFIQENVSSFDWDQQKGLKKNSSALTPAQKRRIGVVLRDLGIYMNQPMIYDEGDNLLSARAL